MVARVFRVTKVTDELQAWSEQTGAVARKNMNAAIRSCDLRRTQVHGVHNRNVPSEGRFGRWLQEKQRWSLCAFLSLTRMIYNLLFL